MQAKRGLAAAAAALAASPLVLGVGLVLFVGVFANDKSPGPVLVGKDTLRVGGDGVPAQYADLIRAAVKDCDQGLTAPVLAAQLQQESGFDPKANSGQAQGIAQFTPDTWGTWGNGGDVWKPEDAIPAQGRFMCSLLKTAKAHPDYNGSAIELALAGYNAGWGRVDEYKGVPPRSFAKGQTYDYVQSIMALVRRFTDSSTGVDSPVDLPPDYQLPDGTPQQVKTAVAWALAQRGGWYQWGGSCTNPLGDAADGRCDCSSLMEQAYAHAGIEIPRVTFEQVKVGTRVSINNPLPGDLVFSPGSDGSDDSPGHVGMYVGNGMVVEAPHTGAQIRVVPYDNWKNSTSPINRVTAVVRIVGA